MAEPVSAAATAAIIVAAAAQKLGEEIGSALGDAIFGSDADKNREQLNQIEENTVKIIRISRATYKLVAQLPDIVEEKIKEGTLNEAHQELDSEIELFISGSGHIPKKMTSETRARLYSLYDSIIDNEDRFEKIMYIPLYGHYLIKISGGALYKLVYNGAKTKHAAIESLIENRKESVLKPLLVSAENIISTPYIRSGQLLSEEPWITWVLAKPRTKSVNKEFCRSSGPDRADGIGCQYMKINVPDTAFNKRISANSKKLHNLRKKISAEAEMLQSAALVKKTLEVFLENISSYDLEEKSGNDIEIGDLQESFQLKSLQSNF